MSQEQVEWPERAKWILVASDGGKLNKRGRVLRFPTKEAAIKWRDRHFSSEGDIIYRPAEDNAP